MVAAEIDVVLANVAIRALLMEANRRLRSHDVAQVKQLCRSALATEPAASDAWHLLAIALAEQDRYPDAAVESDLSQYQLTIILRGFAFSAFGAFVFARRLRKTPCRENREGVRWKGRCGHE